MENKIQNNVTVVKHPLCEHNLGVIRDKNVSSDGFKNSMKRLAAILILEASSLKYFKLFCQLLLPSI